MLQFPKPSKVKRWNTKRKITKDLNDLDQVVTICRNHHHKLHFEWGNNYRQEAIDYITNYYVSNNTN